jgi:hypothetical protein
MIIELGKVTKETKHVSPPFTADSPTSVGLIGS